MALGKIRSARFGSGGYDDAMFGASFTLETSDGCVGDFWGVWNTKETLDVEQSAKTLLRVRNLMRDAQVSEFGEIVGIPIEVTFNGQTLGNWRVLKEVL